MKSVLIAERYPVARAGIRSLLTTFAFARMREVANGNDALQALGDSESDLLLADLQLPGLNGIDLIARVVERHPAVKILVLTGLPESLYARPLLSAGIWGYVPKCSEAGELVTAVEVLLSGQRYLSPRLLDALTDEISSPHGVQGPKLSLREFHVFRMLAAGHRSTDIARSLALPVEAVRADRRRIMNKMSLHSDADVTAYAVRHDLC